MIVTNYSHLLLGSSCDLFLDFPYECNLQYHRGSTHESWRCLTYLLVDHTLRDIIVSSTEDGNET